MRGINHLLESLRGLCETLPPEDALSAFKLGLKQLGGAHAERIRLGEEDSSPTV